MLKKVNGVSSRGSANREHIVGDVMNETCMLIPLSCLHIPKAHSPSSVETPPTVSAIPLLPSPFFSFLIILLRVILHRELSKYCSAHLLMYYKLVENRDCVLCLLPTVGSQEEENRSSAGQDWNIETPSDGPQNRFDCLKFNGKPSISW